MQKISYRIIIVGTSGSGKTTLADKVAEQLKISHIELDSLYWEPNWQAAPVRTFQARVLKALRSDCWVVDGNYDKVRDIIWGRANTVVFLDYPFRVVFTRLFIRTLKRVFKQQELWNGNRETIQQTFFSTDSILLWMIQTYPQRRQQYRDLFQRPEYSHLSIIHLKTSADAEKWLRSL